MNCKNCGATLQLHSSSGNLICQYCHSHQVAQNDQRSLDDLVTSESPTQIFCPCCMEEHQLNLGMLDKVHVAFCPDCFGFLIDSQSMGYVLNSRGKNYQGADDEPVPVDQDDLARKQTCPKCQGHMDTHPYYGPGNVVLNSCGFCKMVWMKNGAIAQLVRAPGVR